MSGFDLLFSHWQFNVTSVVIAALLTWGHYAANGRRFTPKSTLFFAGIGLLFLVTMSPLNYLGHHYLFSAHMLVHISLLLIIPPMLLAGTEGHRLEALFERPVWRHIGDVLFHPMLAWALGIGSMWIWHIPKVLGFAKASPIIMILHMVSLLVIGLIFIWPVYAPIRFHRLGHLNSALYLFTACVGCTILGILITFAPAGLYAQYYAGHESAILDLVRRDWGITTAIDQEAGGLIMWVPACMVYLSNVLITLGRWYRLPDTDDLTESNDRTTAHLPR